MSGDDDVIAQMQELIEQWEAQSDRKAIFLRCYQMMTSNMIAAIEQREFSDPEWVGRLLRHFASFYFEALKAYRQDPVTAPRVWELAHNATGDTSVSALQNLLLGVNAHINYDLVLAVCDLLRPEWQTLADSLRSLRYRDYCLVNDIISHTIDTVQDQVLEKAMPWMDIVDKLLGPADEFMISRLLNHWREMVWKSAVLIVESGNPLEQAQRISQVEKKAISIGEMICPNAARLLQER